MPTAVSCSTPPPVVLSSATTSSYNHPLLKFPIKPQWKIVLHASPTQNYAVLTSTVHKQESYNTTLVTLIYSESKIHFQDTMNMLGQVLSSWTGHIYSISTNKLNMPWLTHFSIEVQLTLSLPQVGYSECES